MPSDHRLRKKRQSGEKKIKYTIDEGKITLTGVPVDTGGRLFNFGCMQWALSTGHFSIEEEGKHVSYVSVKLENLTKGEQWRCKVVGTVTLIKHPEKTKKGESPISSYVIEFKDVFSRSHQYRKFPKFVPKTEMRRDSPYLLNGQFTVVLEMKISSVKQAGYPFYDFFKKSEDSDVVIQLDDKTKFYVNKMYLSMHSAFFKKLFYGDFVEASQAVVALGEVSAGEFNEFLHILYPCRKKIKSVKMIEKMLRLANMWVVPTLMGVCEDKLLSEDCHVKKEKKFELAETHRLTRLKASLMKSLSTKKDVEGALNLQELENDTKDMLIRKLQALLKRSEKASKKDELMDISH